MMKVMLDSGAYGAWKRDQQLDLDEYIAFVKRYEALLGSYINLDLIADGGQPQDLERAAAISYENLKRMKDAGLSAIPVFHQGEQWAWLERMLSDGEKYIALAPHKRIDPDDVVRWLEDAFNII